MSNTGKTLKVVALIWECFLIFGTVVGAFSCSTTLITVVVLIGGLLFALVSGLVLYGFAIIVEHIEASHAAEKPGPSRTKKLSILAKKKEEEEENTAFWVCTCGMKNAEHTVSCKGCGNSRVGAVVCGDGGAYKKCSCGAMVKQGEKCPMCRKMVY